MRELREDTFSRNKNNDAHKHVERILDIVSLFNIPGVAHDVVMLRVFSITLTGAAKSYHNKLDSLGRDMKKLRENVHAIQVGCKTCGGDHLEKECPLHEEVKSVEEVKYEEFGRSFPNNGGNWDKYLGYYTRVDNLPPFGEKKPSLEELMNKHLKESTRKRAKMED
ncbi:hypothetical protein Tco_0729627 [Tanacetum coccineum]|uniref:Uncharacterized protein n=1 Tax=Tanacetum coccineum TaxID=301880 RepID=A0ABQ4YQK2_9ASTR